MFRLWARAFRLAMDASPRLAPKKMDVLSALSSAPLSSRTSAGSAGVGGGALAGGGGGLGVLGEGEQRFLKQCLHQAVESHDGACQQFVWRRCLLVGQQGLGLGGAFRRLDHVGLDGRQVDRGWGGDYQGWVRARKVKAGLHVVVLSPAPRFGPGSFSARSKPTTEVAGVVKQVSMHGRGDASRASAGRDEGGHGWQSHYLIEFD